MFCTIMIYQRNPNDPKVYFLLNSTYGYICNTTYNSKPLTHHFWFWIHEWKGTEMNACSSVTDTMLYFKVSHAWDDRPPHILQTTQGSRTSPESVIFLCCYCAIHTDRKVYFRNPGPFAFPFFRKILWNGSLHSHQPQSSFSKHSTCLEFCWTLLHPHLQNKSKQDRLTGRERERFLETC